MLLRRLSLAITCAQTWLIYGESRIFATKYCDKMGRFLTLLFLSMNASFSSIVWLGAVMVCSTLIGSQLVLSQTRSPVPNRPVSQNRPKDNLADTPWWQMAVNYQVMRNRNQQFAACLFGDSISSALGNTLGEGNVNFALGGMSTTSLLLQMQKLQGANVRCQHAVIAIGTNDAWYGIDDKQFTLQFRQSLMLARSLGAQKITLIPAFYSTVAASKNPKQAGPLPRIDQLNAQINQIAQAEQIPVASTGIQALFRNQALHADYTHDGVHLNAAGKKIYRQILAEIFATAVTTNASGI
jgi:lysophospholipase L1-like esterase